MGKTILTGPSVIILGAGASVHAGAPLLKDFLVAARLLLQRGLVEESEIFVRLFNWIDKLRSSSYYINIDLDNIEHLYSIADMEKQLGLDDGEEHFNDLKNVITTTLLKTCDLGDERESNSTNRRPSSCYLDFIGSLIEVNKNRKEATQDSKDRFEWDSIITFNYDLLLDSLLFGAKNIIKPNYCLASGTPSDLSAGPRYLKLHGSLNWIQCDSCKEIQALETSALHVGEERIPYTFKGDALSKLLTIQRKEHACHSCQNSPSYTNLIIPPTWSKAVANTGIENVWQNAISAIKGCMQIIIIGYSMPETDTFLSYLLALGLRENPHLYRVIIVNPGLTPDLEARYKRVFSSNIQARDKLFFVDKSFEMMVKGVDHFRNPTSPTFKPLFNKDWQP